MLLFQLTQGVCYYFQIAGKGSHYATVFIISILKYTVRKLVCIHDGNHLKLHSTYKSKIQQTSFKKVIRFFSKPRLRRPLVQPEHKAVFQTHFSTVMFATLKYFATLAKKWAFTFHYQLSLWLCTEMNFLLINNRREYFMHLWVSEKYQLPTRLQEETHMLPLMWI